MFGSPSGASIDCKDPEHVGIDPPNDMVRVEQAFPNGGLERTEHGLVYKSGEITFVMPDADSGPQQILYARDLYFFI